MKKYIVLLLLQLMCTLGALAQKQIDVTGNVTDAKNEPIIGASVTVKDVPGLGVISDINGDFKIKVQQYQTLVVSYIGFDSKEILIKDVHEKYHITLNESKAGVLDEVVVTGMGQQKKLTVTGAVTNVNMDDLKHYSTSNLSNTLAGNVPGVLAMQSSGQPGKNTSTFWIRGISTFGASNAAYILVDGFERSNIDDLNIDDIQSFTVLKDASATAIYGSKGANGVILITTKRGSAGKVNISGKFESQYNTRTITPDFVDGNTYANLINEANVTRNRGLVYTDAEREIIRLGLDPDLYPNVDWKDLLLKDGAMSYRANLNISGGGATARYYGSVAYTEDQGMYKTDETLRKQYNTNANYKRWNYRVNLDIDITKTTLLKVGVSGNLNKRNSPGWGDNDIWPELFGYNALSSPIMYSNGYVPATGRQQNQMNPWVAATQTGYNREWDNNIQTNVELNQNLDFITKGLRFVGRFGYDTNNSNYINERKWPKTYKANGRDANGNIIFDTMMTQQDMVQSAGGSGDRHEFLDLLLSYNQTFWKMHNFGANLKFTQDSKIQTQNIGSDVKNSIDRRNMGLAGQFTYNYGLRYFADWNFGYTGSENFARNHRWGFFPAFSLAWNIGEEPFVKKNLPWLEMFKIRYSHGRVGNDKTYTDDNLSGRFPFLSTIAQSVTYNDKGEQTWWEGYNWGTNAMPNSFTGWHYTQVASPWVSWEIATKNDVGVDLALFNSMFTMTVDYFHEKRTGIYIERAFLPLITGLESKPRANVGAVKSQGFDGNFAFHKKFGEFDVTLRGNMTYSKNEVLERDEENQAYQYLLQRGYRVDQVRGLVALGLFKDYDDIKNSPAQAWGTVQPGDIKYKDVNGDGVVNDNDKVAIGATSRPNFIYGMGISVAWRNFDFNLHFQGAGKSTFQIYGKTVFAFSENDWGNILKGMTDNRWISADISGTKATENPNAPYPRLSYGANNNNQQPSSYWLRDGRYLRLKNLDIGYTFPKTWVTAMHLTNLRVYVTGQNLFTWAKFKYWDPEMLDSRGESYPLTRSITLGLNVSL